MQPIYLDVSTGNFTCSSYVACATAPSPGDTTCVPGTPTAIDVSMSECLLPPSDEVPPLEITVDYGDGSGSNKWTSDYKQKLWAHSYTVPGEYDIFVRSE